MDNGLFTNVNAMDLEAAPARPGNRVPAEQTGGFPPAAAGVATQYDAIPLECGGDFLELLGTHFSICNNKSGGNREDSVYECYTEEGGVMGAFDGCGGLGSTACPTVPGHTEAYVASRAVGAAVKEWFRHYGPVEDASAVDDLKAQIKANLELCRKNSGETESRFGGSLSRPFPTTIAMMTFRICEGKLLTGHVWAGDSRTYVLDRMGLAQVSTDDIRGQDAMQNLKRDGALTNVISADGRFKLRRARLQVMSPCILFCATDGCFDYLLSPMAFEHLILSTLLRAENVDQWQRTLGKAMDRNAGDDQTITVATFGFDSFDELQRHFAQRYRRIDEIVGEFEKADDDKKQELWEIYKSGYYRYSAKKE